MLRRTRSILWLSMATQRVEQSHGNIVRERGSHLLHSESRTTIPFTNLDCADLMDWIAQIEQGLTIKPMNIRSN